MRTLLIRHQKIKNNKLELAKKMRRQMTLGERCFWNMVRHEKFEGFHFRRQQVIHGFIADFFCNDLNLVIEIDGGIHEEQKDYDKLRDQIINRYGIRIIRFTNEEVLNNGERVLAKIKELAYPVDKRL